MNRKKREKTLKRVDGTICTKKNKQCTREYLQNDINSVSIHILNDDCLRHIFLFLPIIDRVRIGRVCKRWRILIQDSWRMMKTLNLSYSMFHKTRQHLIQNKTESEYFILLRKILLNCIKLCPNLKSINVSCVEVNRADIQILAKNYKNITKFHLGQTIDNCENELQEFFNINQNLEHVIISDNSEILGKSLSSLPAQTVHTIILEDCYNIEDYYLSTALKKLKNLKHLVIFDCMLIRKYTFETIRKHCKNLRTFEFSSRFSLEQTDLLHLAQLASLRILEITDNFEVSDEFLTSLVRHCQHLTRIDISGCINVTDTGFTAIATLPKLEILTIDNLDKVTGSGLQKICGLRELRCNKCLITDQGMSMLIKFLPRLEYLNISGCKNITNITLNAAKDACNSRSNNINLSMAIGGTSILHELNEEESQQLTPLLEIVNIDFSIDEEE